MAYNAIVAEDDKGGVAKAAGVGLLGVLAMFGRVADDCGRAGVKVASHADDMARFGVKGADDVARFGVKGVDDVADDVLRLADDLPHSTRGPLGPRGPAPVADLPPLTKADEVYRELVESAVEEGAYTALDAWLEEDDGEGARAPSAVGRTLYPPPIVLALWSFLPLAESSLESYLGHAPTLAEYSGHGRFRSDDKLIIKPVYSRLPFDRTFGLREELKVYVGYTAPGKPDHLRSWEAGPVPIRQLQRRCFGRRQACLVVACDGLDFDADQPCALAVMRLSKDLRRTASTRAALQRAVEWRQDEGRADLHFYATVVDDGKPRLLQTRQSLNKTRTNTEPPQAGEASP